MANERDIVLEASTRRDFVDELHAVPGGERVRDCIQCGTCSGSCPVSYYMDNPPRKLLAMLRAGLREQVLSSSSIWLCTSCYMCTLRCPRQIAVTDIMYGLKRIAIAEGKTAGAKTAALASSFAQVVNERGRNFEPELLVRYYLTADPMAMFTQAGLGLQLLRRGRMPLTGEKIRGLHQLRAIVAKTQEMGGL
jgi:quinone-modifying oxidoreductase, subunit QmoC